MIPPVHPRIGANCIIITSGNAVSLRKHTPLRDLQRKAVNNRNIGTKSHFERFVSVESRGELCVFHTSETIIVRKRFLRLCKGISAL